MSNANETHVDGILFVTEFATIIRGEHSRWAGDRIANAGAFLRNFVAENPRNAARIADEIESGDPRYDGIGLSPVTLKVKLPNGLRGGGACL